MILETNRVRIGYWKKLQVRVGHGYPLGTGEGGGLTYVKSAWHKSYLTMIVWKHWKYAPNVPIWDIVPMIRDSETKPVKHTLFYIAN